MPNNIVNNPAKKKRDSQLLVVLSLMLGLFLCMVLAKGIANYSNQATEAEKTGRKVVYSLSKDAIVTEDLLKASKPMEKEIVTSPNIAEKPSASLEDIKYESFNEAIFTQPTIAIIVANIGLNSFSIEEAMKLPEQVAVGILPETTDLKHLARKFTDLNREVVIKLPAKPLENADNEISPVEIKTHLLPNNKLNRIDSLALQVENLSGFYSIDNDEYTQNEDSLKSVLDEIKKQDLLYVFGGNVRKDMINQFMNQNHYPVMVSNFLLEEDMPGEMIVNQFTDVEKFVINNKAAIIMGYPYPKTINLLNKWIASLPAKGIKLVKLEELINLTQKKSE